MVIEKQKYKPICKKFSNFEELKNQFWTNVKKLETLDNSDPEYSRLFYENDELISQIDNFIGS